MDAPKDDPNAFHEEHVREAHRPDWLPIVLGVTTTFAMMGGLTIIGVALGLMEFHATDSVPLLVVKAFWGLVSVAGAMYIGAFVAGLTLSERNRTAAMMDGLLVWELTVIIFGAAGWFGYYPLPGITFTNLTGNVGSTGVIWLGMMLGLPLPFAAAYGAMAGNDHVKKRAEKERLRREAIRRLRREEKLRAA